MSKQPSSADQEAGFTLIELLVVMIIIGILAAIAVPTFLNQRRNAIATSQVADLRSVADEIEGYYVNLDSYPADAEVTWASGQVTISNAGGSGYQRVTVGNTMTYRLDPVTGLAYCIVATNPRAPGPRVWVSNGGGIQPPSVASCPF